MTNVITTRNVPAGEIHDIKVSEKISIEMFRSAKYTGPRDGLEGFLPSKIWKEGNVVWSYQKEDHKFGELFECGDDGYVVAIRDRFTVFSVIRVLDFESMTVVMFAGKPVNLGGSSVEKLFDIKVEIANELKLDFWHSPEESAILQKRFEARREEDRKALLAKTAEKAARRADHEAFVSSVLARNKVEAFAADGRKMFGVPVFVDEEWTCLPDGTYCIMMDLDDKPSEAFIVKKDRQNGVSKKFRSTEVSTEMKKQKSIVNQEIPEALDMVNVTIDGETRSVPIFTDMNDVKMLQKNGLNSGTWVGIKTSDIMTVYAVYSSDIKTLKQVKKVQPSMAVN